MMTTGRNYGLSDDVEYITRDVSYAVEYISNEKVIPADTMTTSYLYWYEVVH